MRLQMSTRVTKADLIEKIKLAREEHQKTYRDALRGWVDQMHTAAEKVIERVKLGDLHSFPKQFHALMNMPSLHLDDYDQALKMLEMSVDNVIELGPEDFDQLVLGNWAWKEAWDMTNASYIR